MLKYIEDIIILKNHICNNIALIIIYMFIELQLHLRRIEEPQETILQCPHLVHLRTLMQLRAALVQHRLDCTILPRQVEMASYRVSDLITQLLYIITILVQLHAL